jgi:hypothetical protein
MRKLLKQENREDVSNTAQTLSYLSVPIMLE